MIVARAGAPVAVTIECWDQGQLRMWAVTGLPVWRIVALVRQLQADYPDGTVSVSQHGQPVRLEEIVA